MIIVLLLGFSFDDLPRYPMRMSKLALFEMTVTESEAVCLTWISWESRTWSNDCQNRGSGRRAFACESPSESFCVAWVTHANHSGCHAAVFSNLACAEGGGCLCSGHQCKGWGKDHQRSLSKMQHDDHDGASLCDMFWPHRSAWRTIAGLDHVWHQDLRESVEMPAVMWYGHRPTCPQRSSDKWKTGAVADGAWLLPLGPRRFLKAMETSTCGSQLGKSIFHWQVMITLATKVPIATPQATGLRACVPQWWSW